MVKTAVVILSEILQSLEDVREVADDLRSHKLSHAMHSEVEIEDASLSAKEVYDIESRDTNAHEMEAGLELLEGCRVIEDKAVEMIRLCLEFIHPL